MDDELERMVYQVVVVLKLCPRIFLGDWEKYENLRQDSWCLVQGVNQAPAAYKFAVTNVPTLMTELLAKPMWAYTVANFRNQHVSEAHAIKTTQLCCLVRASLCGKKNVLSVFHGRVYQSCCSAPTA
jgi:hypothetical protein